MTETTTGLVSAAMLQAVGRDISRRTCYPIAASDIRKWAIAAYHPHRPPARYWDHGSDLTGVVAPQEFNPFAWLTLSPAGFPEVDRLDPDVLEKTLGVPGPGLTHQLNGGLDVSYLQDLVAGDVVTAVRVLQGYREKAGRLGPMLFTTVVETWTNQTGAVVQVREQTGIRH